jgi:hypothetical protein
MSKKRNKSRTVANSANGEAQLILICARLVGIYHECRALNAADNWAPDKGPLNPRYDALLREETALRRRLLHLGIPATREGAVALAKVAFVDAERTHDGIIVARDIYDKLALSVIQSLAGGSVEMVTAAEHHDAREARA